MAAALLQPTAVGQAQAPPFGSPARADHGLQPRAAGVRRPPPALTHPRRWTSVLREVRHSTTPTLGYASWSLQHGRVIDLGPLCRSPASLLLPRCEASPGQLSGAGWQTRLHPRPTSCMPSCTSARAGGPATAALGRLLGQRRCPDALRAGGLQASSSRRCAPGQPPVLGLVYSGAAGRSSAFASLPAPRCLLGRRATLYSWCEVVAEKTKTQHTNMKRML